MKFRKGEGRNTKRDKKAKARYGRLKKGGRFRSMKVKESGKRD